MEQVPSQPESFLSSQSNSAVPLKAVLTSSVIDREGLLYEDLEFPSTHHFPVPALKKNNFLNEQASLAKASSRLTQPSYTKLESTQTAAESERHKPDGCKLSRSQEELEAQVEREGLQELGEGSEEELSGDAREAHTARETLDTACATHRQLLPPLENAPAVESENADAFRLGAVAVPQSHALHGAHMENITEKSYSSTSHESSKPPVPSENPFSEGND